MSEIDTVFISIILTITVIVFIIYEIIMIIRKREKKIVQESSILLKKLLKLNSQYKFDYNVKKQFTFRIYLKSKSRFDCYNFANILKDKILHDNELIQATKIIENNRNLYDTYHKKVNQLQSEITEEQAKILNISYKRYIEIERYLLSKQQVKPILDIDILCIASYTSPKKRNYYCKKAKYNINDISKYYTILQNQNSEYMRKKHARSQMTNKLRYTILKKDRFRCKICGRTAKDGIKLHVDHIIPISKGGKTVISNLRTLCEECNLGKGDEIEQYK